MADTIQIRRDTAANWASVNPVLAQGEMGLETDTERMKLGDGVTAYNSLNYFVNIINYKMYHTPPPSTIVQLFGAPNNIFFPANPPAFVNCAPPKLIFIFGLTPLALHPL